MNTRIPFKTPNESVRKYLRRNPRIFIDLWSSGMVWREIAELVEEQTGLKTYRQELERALKDLITAEDRLKHYQNRYENK